MSYTYRNILLFYLSCILVGWISFWYLCYKLTGFHLSSITINNGISFNGITLETKTFTISLKSIRFRLWGNSKMTIIDGLTLQLKHAIGSNDSKKKKKIKKVRPLDVNPDDPTIAEINLFPKNNIGKYLASWIVRLFPGMNIELRQTTIVSAFGNTTTIEYLKLTMRARSSRKSIDCMSFKTGLYVNTLLHHIKPLNDDSIKPFQIGGIALENKFSVNFKTGILDDLRTRLNIHDGDFSVFNAAKYYIFIDEIYKEELPPPPILTPEELKIKQENKLQRFENFYRTVHAVVSEINVHLETIKLLEIPFVTMNNNADIRHYFNDLRPATCLELVTKSVSFNFSKMRPDAAGFEVLFNSKKQKPYHLTCSVQLLKIYFSTRTVLPTGYDGQMSDEILNVPNFALTYKTNILEQLVRGKGFENCVVEIYFSASTPIFDLDTRQLSALLYNLILVKKWKKLHEFRDLVFSTPLNSPEEYGEFDETQTDSSRMEFNEVNTSTNSYNEPQEKLKSKIWRYLNEYYPRLDIKMVVEQPRIVLRHYEPHKNTQILTFSYSLLNFSLTTTPTRDYATSCQVLYPKTTYHEKSNEDELGKSNEILVKEICHMNYIDVKVDILKNLKVKGLVDFNQLTIDLTNLEIFTGIHYLLLDVTSMVENDLEIGVINKKFNYELLKLRHELKLLSLANPKKPIRNDLEEKIFKYLPHWMTKIEFKLNSLSILLGSRSVLIPKNDLASSEKPDFSFDFDEHHELRQVNFKIESFNLAVSNNGTPDTGDITPSTVSSTASSETLASLTQDTVFWSVNSKLEKLKMSTLTDFEGKFVSLLDIPSLKTDIKALCNYRGHNKLNVTMNMEKLNIDYNRYKFCTLIGTVYLIREFVIAPIKLIKNKIRRDLTRFESLVESTPILHQHSSSLLDFLNVDFKLDYSDIIIRLTDEFKAKLQVSQIQAGLHNKNMEVMVNFIRGLADSPQVQDKWCRLLCLDTLKTKFRVPSSMHDLKLDIETDAIRFIQPHQFVVYKLFDNISITVKLVKHLIKLLKDDSSKEELNIVPPHTQKPKSLPFINVKSKHLKFCMEDDPFETELGMIYQLGLVEQRKRLELYSLFETKSAINRDDPEEYFTKLNRLHTNVSQSWIRKVKTYKAKLRQEIINNKEYLFGHEVHLDESLNNNVVAYPYAPPLVAIYMDKLNLDLSKPKFDLHHLPDFINKYGQGTPKDTKYTLLIPLFLNLQMSELRMHLRDYPLPILHSPRNKDIDDKTFTLKGHLIITEAFVDAPEHIRRIDVPLVPHKPNITLNKYEALVVEKTLASVKMYTNLECGFRSNYPTRIIWGTSYNFGIQQLMLNFDKFSKPPVDPSIKLGFWDKLKYVLHGKCTIKTKKSLEVGFKGSRDPYDLFAEGGGFVLSFRKNVVWDINKDDDSRNFFDVTADKVSWYIPNYLGGPLLVWTRNSTESVYLPDSPHMISSCYAYYLGESQGKLDFDYANNVFEKNVINLSGGVHYQVGFLLQRDDANGERTDKCKPHYEVQLYNPEYCKKGHDSYDGFRSEYIHMAISLKSSNESSYNTIHLSPGVFVQLFSWWKLFASNLQLPIRRGKMFGEPKSSVKFSQHLFTNKFSFNLKSLFIAHVYRDEIIDLHNDKIECVGLRAKVEDFIVDLHQRKEPRTVYHEELSKNKKIMKMNFDLGEVNMSDIDLRVMHVTFYQNLYTQTTHGDERQSTFKIFDNDKRWFDSDDFEEVFLSSIEKCARDVEIFPLTFLQRFSYERDTHDSIQPKEAFGREDIHECTLGKINPLNTKIKVFNDRLEALEEQLSKIPRKDDAVATDLRRRISFLGSEIKQAKRKAKSKLTRSSSISDLDKAENYHNKFTLLNTLLKWNFDSRNLTMQYIHFVKLRSAMRKYLSHESIETLEKIMDKANAVLDSDDLSSSSTNIIRQFTRDYSRSQASYGKDFTSQDRISNYNDILREKSPDEEIVEDYLIDIVAPQIQLQSEDHPDSV
ncbi:putative mitochondrial protein, putative, partial [Candida maltosa Xu316]